MTIPAMAPPLSELETELLAFTTFGVVDADTDVCEAADVNDDIAEALELITLDDTAPKICANSTGLIS